jgi:ubiquinone/menaquinone biosynthesis C-methylase UbiE
MLKYYTRVDESQRLTRLESELELLRTRDILSRWLPVPPAIVLDIGGGPAVHSHWLAEHGYRVHLVDIVPDHVDLAQILDEQQSHKLQSIHLGDACNLPFESESAEAVVMLGPLYHLTKRNDRITALQEAYRVLRPGSFLLAGAISRYIPMVKVLTRNLLDQRSMSIARQTAYTGQHRPDPDQDFFTTAFFHHPSGLEREIKQAGFQLRTTLAVEGPARLLGEQFRERWSHPDTKQWLLDLTRNMESDRTLLGVSGHMIAVARKPAAERRP